MVAPQGTSYQSSLLSGVFLVLGFLSVLSRVPAVRFGISGHVAKSSEKDSSPLALTLLRDCSLQLHVILLVSACVVLAQTSRPGRDVSSLVKDPGGQAETWWPSGSLLACFLLLSIPHLWSLE